ncbi:hypothetical protein [Sphingobacterium bambusae]|uniref:DUF3822 domain-containing protein n=1 Tax=Sphingobacterium bambusae TaxID=662858 RepID=A0ABW6BQK1_9SPHI|nr:hypothetical protein [Sphingobacterium bambusae]WPL48171.1 hypothetical protein SCB77_19645 [Sphingobacterium bambusae]
MITNNPSDIYFFRPDLPTIDTAILFNITQENEGLRVQNQHVSFLFAHLNEKEFDEIYNKFNQHLNLNFEPLMVKSKVVELTAPEKESLLQRIIMHWIYYYTVNHLPVLVQRSDFLHPQTTDEVIWALNEKFNLKNRDTQLSLLFGAHILRRDIADYTGDVKGRRIYYDR